MSKLLRATALSVVLLLAACGSKVTPENYEKIRNKMSQDEVYSILGKPTEVSSAGIGNLSASNEVWKGKTHTITVTFGNGSVGFKTIVSNADRKSQDK
ncbi:MAG: hypothetical protein ACRETN_13420 [Nevskiales bacterium]